MIKYEFRASEFMTVREKDLAKAMVAEAARYVPKLLEVAHAQQRSADLAEAARLAAKHGVEGHLTD